ncbi:3-hydroxybutyrate dehydrogenase/3-oxoacyl-[acyl-carrier protein] reductase [Pseudonocardia thermophila]|uniref:3-hydroxybutyrate dehydrogenase/3-oxoacyl-[acyl-carrier protein] reductase n=1 Tax=Pseudonocardia thermophila TaxID=1848 RepID=A0A1M7A192_PSETH|nr:SDR family NAD(P)-dependent oxidoreductase [Pseudonocardia thermophila]SHL36375.1 3-hydroxybutyrate dehydrogenase/3-oxoacyl-[acyl-carrier protein] reductase [Pseudonocardia thermophila]
MSARVAIVTGGAGGLGRTIGEVLHADGFRVALLDLKGAPEVAGELGVLGVPVDVTDEESVRTALARVEQEWGRVDALVNNAGVEPPHTLETVDPATWAQTLDVNLAGPALMIKNCIPLFRRAGGGRIVNIGSRTWLGGGASAAYAAAKAGLVGLTRQAARELGPLGVTVNVVAPSFLRTPLNATKGDPEFVEAFAERFAAASPLGRLVEPREVAHAVAFLLSEPAGAITGETLHVTAGTHLAPYIH